MKNYEMVIILDPGLDSTAFVEKSKFIEERIRSNGGEIQKVAQWGKRKLAYDIRKKDAGYYVVINFEAESEDLLNFKESIKHDEEILRYLIVVKREPAVDEPPSDEQAEETQESDLKTEKVAEAEEVKE